MKGRALTDQQKRAVVERLLAAWRVVPKLRLGQLLINSEGLGRDLFYIEDETLAELVEAFVEEAFVKE